TSAGDNPSENMLHYRSPGLFKLWKVRLNRHIIEELTQHSPRKALFKGHTAGRKNGSAFYRDVPRKAFSKRGFSDTRGTVKQARPSRATLCTLGPNMSQGVQLPNPTNKL
ncbi:MAG TPA: hypothetical protein VK966_13970, partial [Longimicrobiales bacterium]|nr:hypothetical protein [Longimicrobiales bacterium]